MRAAALALLVAAGCGGQSWTDADAKSATSAARMEVWVERLCADGMPCKPEQVRALERQAYCSNASQLARHGQPYPDAGIACQPQ